jgi:hypothetical protein
LLESAKADKPAISLGGLPKRSKPYIRIYGTVSIAGVKFY